MIYRIISVGKLREPFYQQGSREYLKRLTAYNRIELLDGLEEKLSPKAGDKDVEKVLDKEADRILALFNRDDYLVLLDVQGREIDSPVLAHYINVWNQSPYKRINFLIGSAHGVAGRVKARADVALSLSRLTLPHQMAVLLLTEQLYRGFKILKNEPYHH
ncbi:MAG: 23S rRNA (pseudouridine(1915)-N(3))-methyltransferase RlmH [Syntrophomonadaceae bacterium]